MPKIKEVHPGLFKMEKEGEMRVDGYIVGTKSLLEGMRRDKTLWQLSNVASLPGIVEKALLMPDGHEGYGFPIGGVAAFDAEKGIVSPGGIGYDINCGVRLFLTDLHKDDVIKKSKELAEMFFKLIPTGVGAEQKEKISVDELDILLEEGIDWAVEKEYAYKKDKEHIEELGRMIGAQSSAVSPTAKKRGRRQVGTLGAGNHFIEVQYVQRIFDERTAKAFGLDEGQVVVMIHTGSRGLGHQVATDYIHKFLPIARHEHFFMPDEELVYMPLVREEAQQYLAAMKAAVNFAFVNRQMIMALAREAIYRIFGEDAGELPLLYDVAHNIAKEELHKVNGEERKLLVHRKGATRAFPAGREEVPPAYRSVGQPVLIPGSMGTSSYVLVGQPRSLEVSFGSSCHGAGRRMSRRKAIHTFKGEKLVEELWKKEHIYVKPKTWKVAAEEAPQAYKDVDEVIKAVEGVGISKAVSRNKPLVVVKG